MNEFVNLDDGAQGTPVGDSLGAPPASPVQGCVVSRRTLDELGLVSIYPSDGVTLSVVEDLVDAVRLLATRRSGFSIVFVMYDDFAHLYSTVDLLRRLRFRSPNLPVVLISDAFGTHDLGQERLCITDISLRGPMSAGLMRIAVAAATENNLAWRKRRRSLRLEKARL